MFKEELDVEAKFNRLLHENARTVDVIHEGKDPSEKSLEESWRIDQFIHRFLLARRISMLDLSQLETEIQDLERRLEAKGIQFDVLPSGQKLLRIKTK